MSFKRVKTLVVVISLIAPISVAQSRYIHDGTAAPAAASQTQSRGANDAVPRMTPAEKFAIDLERRYQQSGYDIDVSIVDHELRLKSDLLQDAALRESLVSALAKDSQTLCGLEIWYLKVGYSKGWFSSDVMKSASLGCPAAKAARLKEMKASRDELAAQLNSPEEGIKIHAEGTILVCESNFFGEAENRTNFVQMMLGNHQKLCDIEFSAIQLIKGGKVVKTAPIQCR
jgi:hypothetical protein